MAPGPVPIFDGHNDVLIRLDDGSRDFFQRGEGGHVDLPRAREGGLAGGFCAIFTASADPGGVDERPPRGPGIPYERPFDPTPELARAQSRTIEIMARLFRIEERSEGQVAVVRTAAEIETCLQEGRFAALMHIEGAEAIDPELNALEVFWRAGLRSLGLVWSRPNAFGCGVPFKYPSSPDTGPGLTDAGRHLVRACNHLRILIDLSHLNEAGFWDVAALTDAPLVATHSNAWSLAPTSRNLTDDQLAAIRDTSGMVGVNFAVSFLRQDGALEASTPLDTVVRHFDYLVERVGLDGVGFGSDFDGATVPQEIGDATGLQRVLDALRRAGYDESSIRKLAHENWIRVLRATWAD